MVCDAAVSCTVTLAYQCRLLNKPALLRCRHGTSIVAKSWTVLRILLYKISNKRCRILISPIHPPWPLLSGQLYHQIKKRIISFVFVFLFISRSTLPNYWLACYVRYPVLFVCSVFIIRLLLFQFIEKMFQVYLALGIRFEPYLSLFWPYLQDCPHVVAKKRDCLKLSFPLLLYIYIYDWFRQLLFVSLRFFFSYPPWHPLLQTIDGHLSLLTTWYAFFSPLACGDDLHDVCILSNF